MNAIRVVNCPTCGARVDWKPESKFRPFCSERCKMIDLGAWANEKFRIPEADPHEGDDPEGR